VVLGAFDGQFVTRATRLVSIADSLPMSYHNDFITSRADSEITISCGFNCMHCQCN
jgi:hypothetical protein